LSSFEIVQRLYYQCFTAILKNIKQLNNFQPLRKNDESINPAGLGHWLPMFTFAQNIYYANITVAAASTFLVLVFLSCCQTGRQPARTWFPGIGVGCQSHADRR
jgi:hypothetical protein